MAIREALRRAVKVVQIFAGWEIRARLLERGVQVDLDGQFTAIVARTG